MPASPIRKLIPFAEAAKKRGTQVFHLNIGQPDIRTPKEALDAIRGLKEEVIEYSHSAGNESYRRGLADYYKGIGIAVDFSDILITTGGSEALLFAFWACLNPGDEVIVTEPFYTNYNGFAVEAGVNLVPVTSHIQDGFALPPMSAIEEKVSAKTRAILICNPNNPTGYLYSKQELLQLREIVLKHDLFLFSDEVYREFCYDGHEHFSVMQLEGLEKNVLLVDSVSKRYSACGVRIGALVSRNPEVVAAALKFGQARLSPPGLGQIVGEAALRTGSDYFAEVYHEYIERRDLVVEALNRMEGVFCPTPKGAFYTIVRLPIRDSEHFCQWLLDSFSFEGSTVMLAPASGFYSTPGLGRDEVRLAYVLEKDKLQQAMHCLEQALKEYPESTLKQ